MIPYLIFRYMQYFLNIFFCNISRLLRITTIIALALCITITI